MTTLLSTIIIALGVLAITAIAVTYILKYKREVALHLKTFTELKKRN